MAKIKNKNVKKISVLLPNELFDFVNNFRERFETFTNCLIRLLEIARKKINGD